MNETNETTGQRISSITDRCEHVDAVLNKINSHGERIKKLKEEILRAFSDGLQVGKDTARKEHIKKLGEEVEQAWLEGRASLMMFAYRNEAWEASRAKRIAEGLE